MNKDVIYRQDAIDALCKAGCGSGYCEIPCDDVKAIKQLPSAQPKHDENPCREQGDSDKFGVKTSETCADCISRQAAIDAMANTLWHYPNECYRNLNEYEFAKGLAELGLKSVPPAPERKTGKWIDAKYPFSKCSICECYFDTANNIGNFCPDCGADMREG